MKLYRVNIRSRGRYGISYVVASDSEKAYRLVRKYLDENDICFSKDRVMESVHLIADLYKYSNIPILYLEKSQ